MTIAVISNDLSIAKMLIEEYDADIRGELEDGRNLFQIACEHSNTAFATYMAEVVFNVFGQANHLVSRTMISIRNFLI